MDSTASKNLKGTIYNKEGDCKMETQPQNLALVADSQINVL